MRASIPTVIDRLERLGCRPKGYGEKWTALCPAHDDKNPSLGVTAGRDGEAFVKCHAGCSFGAIQNALAIEEDRPRAARKAPTRTPSGAGSPAPWKRPIRAVYTYRDRRGNVIFENVRFGDTDEAGKKMMPRFPDRSRPGQWSWKPAPIDRPLYLLPELLSAVAAGSTIYLPEGERDVESLRALGLDATTNPNGASGWKPEYADDLRGADVVILPDNDSPGRTHAGIVAKSLLGLAGSIRIVELPGLLEKGDVSDWIAAGGTREALEALLADAPEFKGDEQGASPTYGDDGRTDPIDLGRLLDDVVAFVTRYVVLSADQAILCALWVIHAYAIDAADATGYLIVTSPERRCGKSRLVEVLLAVVRNAWYVVRPSEPVLFRKLSQGAVLFLDEYDTIFSAAAKDSTEGIRAALNAGHSRGAAVPRCTDHGKVIEDFPVFGPKVLAGIGDPPDTVKDRGFVISMRRARRTDARDRYRRREAKPEADQIMVQIERWVAQKGILDALRAARPPLPEKLNDRAQDSAEAMLAIADLAEGAWPAKARVSFVRLAGEAAVDEVSERGGVALLRDLVRVFGLLQDPKGVRTETLLGELCALDGAPWKKFRKGEPLDENGLASLLRPFKVYPKKKRWHIGEGPRAGYLRVDVLDAAERYVPEIPTEDENDDQNVIGVPPPERPERRNELAAGAVPTVPPPPGTDPGTGALEKAGSAVRQAEGNEDRPVPPFRPPFRPTPERLDPHEQTPRSDVPGVPAPSPGGGEKPLSEPSGRRTVIL